MSKRKFEEETEYDEVNTKQKVEDVTTVTLSENIYDSNDWSIKTIDITQSILDWKEFVHELGYNKVFFSELGHPDPSKREKPLFLNGVNKATKGKGLSSNFIPAPYVCEAQTFPDVANVYKSDNCFYIMVPMKLTEAFMYPLGNFKRQFKPKDGSDTNFCPQDEHDSVGTKLKYNMCYNNSAPNANYSVKDPVSVEALNWLQCYEIELRKQVKTLKPKFCKAKNNNLEVSWVPFAEIPADVIKEKGTDHLDFTPIHKDLVAFQSKKKYVFKGTPLAFRLNPDYNKTEDAKPLIEIPMEEQHAYQLENDFHLVVFKANRHVSNNLCIDLSHWISLEGGYEGAPGSHWFDQAKPRPILMDKDALFNREQNPLKSYGSNLFG